MCTLGRDTTDALPVVPDEKEDNGVDWDNDNADSKEAMIPLKGADGSPGSPTQKTKFERNKLTNKSCATVAKDMPRSNDAMGKRDKRAASLLCIYSHSTFYILHSTL